MAEQHKGAPEGERAGAKVMNKSINGSHQNSFVPSRPLCFARQSEPSESVRRPLLPVARPQSAAFSPLTRTLPQSAPGPQTAVAAVKLASERWLVKRVARGRRENRPPPEASVCAPAAGPEIGRHLVAM